MYFERFWRKATPQDAIKQPSMVARCIDDDGKWSIVVLTGYDSDPIDEGHHWLFKEDSADNAEVYDPPANFELGEGYEFVDAKKEPKAKDVEFWWHNGDWSRGRWEKRPYYYGNLTDYDIYRRKIKVAPKYRLMKPTEVIHSDCLMNHKNNDQSLDPIAPGWMQASGWIVGTLANHDELNFACPIGESLISYEPFAWEDRYEIINKEICHKNRKIFMVIHDIRDIDGVFYINYINSNDLMKNYIFDGTKFPAGKKVTKVAE